MTSSEIGRISEIDLLFTGQDGRQPEAKSVNPVVRREAASKRRPGGRALKIVVADLDAFLAIASRVVDLQADRAQFVPTLFVSFAVPNTMVSNSMRDKMRAGSAASQVSTVPSSCWSQSNRRLQHRGQLHSRV